jgi:hypothetical protein
MEGKPMDVSIYTISGYKGEGKYPIGGSENANINIYFNHGQYIWATGSGPGTVTINHDQKTGYVKADIAGPAGSEHVTGSWKCDEVTVY